MVEGAVILDEYDDVLDVGHGRVELHHGGDVVEFIPERAAVRVLQKIKKH